MSRFVPIDWAGRPVRLEVRHVVPAGSGPDADGPGLGGAPRPLVVFLHEGLGSVSMWRDFPQRFADATGADVLAWSRPGYGRSTPRAAGEAWDVDFMHRQAHEVLPALLAALQVDAQARPLVLLGHSDGGSIALLHAARPTQPVAGLIVLAPHIVVEERLLDSIARAREAYRTTDLRGRLARHHDDPDSAFWGWNDIWLHPRFRHWSIQDEIRTIACPVLAIQGVDDEYGTLEQIRGIARVVPRTRLPELPSCGHSPHRDRPEAVLAASRSFLDTLDTQARGDTASALPPPVPPSRSPVLCID